MENKPGYYSHYRNGDNVPCYTFLREDDGRETFPHDLDANPGEILVFLSEKTIKEYTSGEFPVIFH